MDWASRRVLSWRISITLDSIFCIAAVEEAIARFGHPEIFNTDQGAQFTSVAFTGLLRDEGIRLSMDGKGCWRDKHLRRTALALAQVRRGLPAPLRHRVRRDGRYQRLPHAIQHPPSALESRRPDPRRGILLPAAAVRSGLTTPLSTYPSPFRCTEKRSHFSFSTSKRGDSTPRIHSALVRLIYLWHRLLCEARQQRIAHR